MTKEKLTEAYKTVKNGIASTYKKIAMQLFFLLFS